MALSVLYIGGTGQISLPCVELSVAAGHAVTVLNRGKSSDLLPTGVETIAGDMTGDPYGNLGDRRFDIVAQFRLFTPEQMRRDIDAFSGRTGQYVFISSASVYQKPVRDCPITERTPQENPFWEYSRQKTACEALLREQDALPFTIVRPSHTVRTMLPIEVGDADNAVRRMIAGKPVIVTGDGSSLWTLTRSVDVARALTRLLGNGAALGEDFHITTDDTADPTQLRLVLPIRMRPHGGRTWIIGGADAPARPDPVLIRALRAAHAMLGHDAAGAPVIEAIPASPYQRRLLPLAFLAPDLQRAF